MRMRMRAPSVFLLAVAASVANGGRNGSVLAFRSSPPSFAVRRNNKPHQQQQQQQARRTGLQQLRLVPSQRQEQQQHPYHLRTKRATLLVLKENYADDADSEKDEGDDAGDEEAFEEFAKTTLSTDEDEGDEDGGGETPIAREEERVDDQTKASSTPAPTPSGINGDAASGGGGSEGRPAGGRNSAYTTGAAAAAAAAARAGTTTAAPPDSLPFLELLQSLGAITCRGEFADARQRTTAEKCLASLESGFAAEKQPADTSMLQGTWELVYSTTPNLFRSSPFFMAGRAVCTTRDAVDQYNFFCDMHRKALAVSTIKSIRQVVSRDKLVSEFEVTAGAVPFLSDLTPFRYSGGLPVTVDGAIVSSADIESIGRSGPIDDSNGGSGNHSLDVTLYMDTVEIKGSNVPGLRQVLDAGLKLQSRQLAGILERVASNGAVPISYRTPRPVFRTTYLTETFRISRDQDDHAFLYVKTSPDTSPTDYSSVDPDLGVARLLERFNDAVTKFYL